MHPLEMVRKKESSRKRKLGEDFSFTYDEMEAFVSANFPDESWDDGFDTSLSWNEDDSEWIDYNQWNPTVNAETPSWFNENDPNSFTLPTTYDPVLINTLPNTITNTGLTEAYINQFEINPGTDWSVVLKDIGNVLKDVATIGTPIAATILKTMQSNTVSQDSISSLSNSLKQMGLLNSSVSSSSLTDMAKALGIGVTGKTDLRLQQELALLAAKKQLEEQQAQQKKDDWIKYGIVGAGILFGLILLKKM